MWKGSAVERARLVRALHPCQIKPPGRDQRIRKSEQETPVVPFFENGTTRVCNVGAEQWDEVKPPQRLGAPKANRMALP